MFNVNELNPVTLFAVNGIRTYAPELMLRIELAAVPTGERSPCAAHTGSRPVFFGEVDGFVASDVYDRYALCVGNVIGGPAIIEEVDSTTVVHPGYQVEVGQFGVLMLRRAAVAC